jgi:hypothetical protein
LVQHAAAPKEMIVRPAPLPVLPVPSIIFQAVDRPGIRIPLVEVLNFRRYPTGWRMLFFFLAHRRSINRCAVHLRARFAPRSFISELMSAELEWVLPLAY